MNWNKYNIPYSSTKSFAEIAVMESRMKDVFLDDLIAEFGIAYMPPDIIDGVKKFLWAQNGPQLTNVYVGAVVLIPLIKLAYGELDEMDMVPITNN